MNTNDQTMRMLRVICAPLVANNSFLCCVVYMLSVRLMRSFQLVRSYTIISPFISLLYIQFCMYKSRNINVSTTFINNKQYLCKYFVSFKIQKLIPTKYHRLNPFYFIAYPKIKSFKCWHTPKRLRCYTPKRFKMR